MTTTRPIPITPIARPKRRGIALLLVMVTLATATVLTTSFLISRENSPDIGLMAERRVASEWSCKSAMDVAIAMMQTETDWRAIANSGLLIDSMPHLGAEVNVAVTDLDGGTVDDDDRHVVMTVMATVEGVETVTQRVLSVRPDGTYEDALDPELREFGVYATRSVDIDSSSRIGLWPLSPSVRAGDSGKIGVGFDSASGFSAGSGSLPSSGTVFLPPNPSLSLESAVSSGGSKYTSLPLEVWSTTAERPASMLSGLIPIPVDVEIEANATIPSADYRRRVDVEDGAVMTLDGEHGGFVFGTAGDSGSGLRIEDGSTLRIVNDVEIAVLGSLTVDDGAIELADGATLTVYYDGAVDLKDAVVGADPALKSVSSRTPDDLTAYTDPRRIRFIQLNETPNISEDRVEIRERSVVVGSFHSPMSRVRVRQDSVVAGRMTAGELTLQDRGELLLDPIFDNKLGITEATSPLYDENGDPIPGLVDALAGTSDAEGFASALSRILAELPPLTPPAPDGGKAGPTPRFGERVTTLRDWPVLVRVQETPAGQAPVDAIFVPIKDGAIASEMGSTVDKASGGGAEGGGGGKPSVVNDVLSAVLGGENDDDD